MRYKRLALLALLCVVLASAAPALAAEAPGGTDVQFWDDPTRQGVFLARIDVPENAAGDPVEMVVWPLGYQSATVVYETIATGRLTYTAEISTAKHGGRVGTYCVTAYLVNAQGERTLIGSGSKRIDPVAGQLRAAQTDGSQTSFALSLRGAVVPENSRVVFCAQPAPGAAGKTARVIAKKKAGVYEAVLPTSRLGSPGRYTVKAYCTMAGGELAEIGTAVVSVSGLSSGTASVEQEDGRGTFEIVASAKAPERIRGMHAEVWPENNPHNVHTYPMLPREGRWTVRANIEDFDRYTGRYEVRVHATLINGVQDIVATANAQVRPVNYMWTEKNAKSCLIHIENVDPAVQNVRVDAWSEANGQDDIVWYTANRVTDTSWLARAEFRRHRNSGTFRAQLHIDDTASGTISFEVTEDEIPEKETMRGVWVPTVWNLDFPHKADNAAKQQEEFRQLVRQAKAWGFNTIFLQVRPTADALYQSEINPWSDVLTGTWGAHPGYDPLGFAIEAAHDAGIELHAWLNPYRVCPTSQRYRLSPMSVAVQHPDWVFEYKGTVYLDPGNPGVRQHVTDTVREIIAKYDVDGIHFDDYFYPYDYPLPRGEQRDGEVASQRRENVNMLVRMVAEEVHSCPRSLKFGISPFGIWKNADSDPKGSDTNGSESYYDNYCDTVQWLREGLLDYVAPQLYWSRGNPAASYSKLVDWWARQVQGTGTDLIIGQGIAEKAVAAEIEQQLDINAQYDAVRGSIFYRYGELAAAPSLGDRIANWYRQHG